jgi:glutaredoxin-like protein NrdH
LRHRSGTPGVPRLENRTAFDYGILHCTPRAEDTMSQPIVIVYGLSTCVHCRHAREYLEKEHISFNITYVDKLDGAERADALEKVREVNPRISFPTLLVGPAHTVVIGFNPEAIQEALHQ